MSTQTRVRRWVFAALATMIPGVVGASDHADPMSMNVFAKQKSPEANITDLHAFIVDANQRRVTSGDPLAAGNRLVISLCVRRALTERDETMLDFDGYKFRIHVDLDPRVRFVDEPVPGADSAALQRDRAMEALYGAIFTHPADIADDVLLEFQLRRDPRSAEPRVRLETPLQFSGIAGAPTILEQGQQPSGDDVAVTTGVFDDPFIFPRFFRKNVVGIVTSIPLSRIPQLRIAKRRHVPILLWATTHKGATQIDHVGRSLRTQLPRFGYLNDQPPSAHVREIQRVHAAPTVAEALLGTAIPPLFAHRHYDSVPDVMVYDLRKPAQFPNGRALQDDVAKQLADAGETLLLELSYAESRQYPRATENDRPFGDTFPYLAPAWTEKALAIPNDGIPRAPDAAAIAAPDLDPVVWQRLAFSVEAALVLLTILLNVVIRSRGWRAGLTILALIGLARLGLVYGPGIPGVMAVAKAIAVLVLAGLLGLAVRLTPVRWLVALLAVFALWQVHGAYASSPTVGMKVDPAERLSHLVCGLLLTIGFGIGFVFAAGRRSITPEPFPEPSTADDRQAPMPDDARQASYSEIHRALFDPAASRQYYGVWGRSGERQLPKYKTTLGGLLSGALSPRGHGVFAMLSAARRTLSTKGDLRWGVDHNGFRRLVHPMGVCLAGWWKIDDDAPTGFTGYFAPGSEGRVIARYSLGGNHPKGGRNRSLGLVGKIFPALDSKVGITPRAHFITQEDLGGAYTESIADAVLTNSPPVSLARRGTGLLGFLAVIRALQISDQEPAERQLYEVAELEKPLGQRTSCPKFMRLTMAPGARRKARVDFRDELLGMMYDPGDATKKRDLVFVIEVSDTGRRTAFQSLVGQAPWRRVGTLTFSEAAASYNGDFVVHFHHPPWRNDRNDPTSVARIELR